MHHLVEPILDGTLATLFPRGLTVAFSTWLGVLLLAATGVGALVLDLTRRPSAVAADAHGPVVATAGPLRARRALLVLTVLCAAAAAVATLVRFALALS